MYTTVGVEEDVLLWLGQVERDRLSVRYVNVSGNLVSDGGRGSCTHKMSVVFYYDVVCPFAYCASHLVEAMASRTGAQLHWRPVLLG